MTNEVTVIEKNLPAVANFDFEQDAGAGFENTTASDYSIPFLVVLQKGSPQVDADSPTKIEGARQGMLFNTSTEELLNKNDEGVKLIPCYYEKVYLEWTPRTQGGGLKGTHSIDSEVIQKAIARNKGDKMAKLVTADGNDLIETARYYCLLVNEESQSFSRIIVPMSSTQLKKSRRWLDKADSIKIKGSNGKFFTPPLFSHMYLVTTVSESNEKGTWRGYKIEIDKMLDSKDEFHQDLYVSAKGFRQLISDGVVKAAEPVSEAAYEDEGAF